MNNSLLAPALASLFAFALPAQAQNAPQPFNPMAMLAPMMTPLGMMLVPTSPSASPFAGFNPATLFNPAMFNSPQFNPAMLPRMPMAPPPVGMVPFTGLQETPEAYGMPAQMPNPFVGMPQPMPNPFASMQQPNPFSGMQQPMVNPFAVMQQFTPPQMPNQAAFPMLQGFPGFPFPSAR